MVDTTKNNYQILDQVNLSNYTKLGDLYTKIVSLKKDPYADNERIIFVYNPNADKILKTVNELLEFVDIPTYFVIFEQDTSLPLAELDFTPTDSHCIYPWINFVIVNDGEIRPCCKYDEPIPPVAKIQNDKLVDLYQSNYMVKLREDFRNGVRPSACSKCWHEESMGITSMRQAAKFKFKDIWYTVDYTKNDYNNLQLLDLKLGNECNLSCRICNYEASSKIAEFDLKHGNITSKQYQLIKDSSKWGEQDEFYDQLIPIAHNIRYLDIFGGEPLMIRRHFDFLKKLVELNVAQNISLDYNSNGTLYSESFFDIWKHFKQVKISFSIDDVGQRFELQRNGAAWSKVQENITRYSLKKSDSFLIDIYPTVSIMNIYYLPELLDWISQQNFSHPPSLNLLHTPAFLSAENLTEDARILVLEKFKKFSHYSLIAPFIQKLEDLKCAAINQAFIDYTKRLDILRNQSFAITHPEIAKAMKCD